MDIRRKLAEEIVETELFYSKTTPGYRGESNLVGGILGRHAGDIIGPNNDKCAEQYYPSK